MKLATIYYATDGSDPTTSSTRIQYTSAIAINTTTTLKFAAIDTTGNWSPVYNETYTIDNIVPRAGVDNKGGLFNYNKSVRLWK